jgi:hypothetical protein
MYLEESLGVNVTVSRCVPIGKTAPISGTYVNDPPTGEVAFNCLSESGVPATMGGGETHVICGDIRACKDGEATVFLHASHATAPRPAPTKMKTTSDIERFLRI